jgi:nucleoside-diphosphate-sugar epimerase
MTKMLMTGASGFVGRIIKPILTKEYTLTTCGRQENNDIIVDLSKDVPQLTERYDIVLHAAGKAHTIPKTETQIKEFFDTNVLGTKNLCSALEKVGVPNSLVFISTVAVYGCITGSHIDEKAPLNGTTPYAQSKIQAEIFLQEWCAAHNCKFVILRPPLIVGANASANLQSMVDSIKRGFYMNIGGGNALKSFLMAEDIAYALPHVIEHSGIYNICDSQDLTIHDMSCIIAKQLNRPTPINIPYRLAWALAKVGDLLGSRTPINSAKLTKLISPLTFSNAKLCSLGWTPLNVQTHYKVYKDNTI